jgi:hypothetical protein
LRFLQPMGDGHRSKGGGKGKAGGGGKGHIGGRGGKQRGTGGGSNQDPLPKHYDESSLLVCKHCKVKNKPWRTECFGCGKAGIPGTGVRPACEKEPGAKPKGKPKQQAAKKQHASTELTGGSKPSGARHAKGSAMGTGEGDELQLAESNAKSYRYMYEQAVSTFNSGAEVEAFALKSAAAESHLDEVRLRHRPSDSK